LNRVLIDLRPLRPPLAGVGRYCLHLASELERYSSELRLLGLYYGNQRNNAILATLSDLHVPSVSRAHPKLLNAILEFTPALAPIVVPARVDLVHETYFAHAAAGRRAKRVCTIHDIIPIDEPAFVNHRNRFFSRRNFARQCRQANHIISISAYTKRRILEHYDISEDRISVIPCGVTPIASVRDDAILSTNGLIGTRFVLFVGNIEPRKNVCSIVDALRALGHNDDDVHLVVAGHKNYHADAILERARTVLGSRFHYLGTVTEAQKRALLESAALFVFPSLYEGFGIPIVECYQAGCAVLIADNSASSELHVDPNQLFDALSVQSLAARIADALARPAWLEHSIARGKSMVAGYTWTSVARRTADVYRGVLGSLR
jgi:glycosyltransferase involved in cell wall biosynthesis